MPKDSAFASFPKHLQGGIDERFAGTDFENLPEPIKTFTFSTHESQIRLVNHLKIRFPSEPINNMIKIGAFELSTESLNLTHLSSWFDFIFPTQTRSSKTLINVPSILTGSNELSPYYFKSLHNFVKRADMGTFYSNLTKNIKSQRSFLSYFRHEPGTGASFIAHHAFQKLSQQYPCAIFKTLTNFKNVDRTVLNSLKEKFGNTPFFLLIDVPINDSHIQEFFSFLSDYLNIRLVVCIRSIFSFPQNSSTSTQKKLSRSEKQKKKRDNIFNYSIQTYLSDSELDSLQRLFNSQFDLHFNLTISNRPIVSRFPFLFAIFGKFPKVSKLSDIIQFYFETFIPNFIGIINSLSLHQITVFIY